MSFYGGFLIDEKYTDRVCLKKTGVITFPEPPDAISDCILTRGDQIAEEFTAPGQSHQVPIKIRHPRNKEEFIITARVNKIEKCASTTTSPNTTSPTLSAKDPEKSAFHIFLGLASIPVCMTLVGLVYMIRTNCIPKCKNCSNDENRLC